VQILEEKSWNTYGNIFGIALPASLSRDLAQGITAREPQAPCTVGQRAERTDGQRTGGRGAWGVGRGGLLRPGGAREEPQKSLCSVIDDSSSLSALRDARVRQQLDSELQVCGLW